MGVCKFFLLDSQPHCTALSKEREGLVGIMVQQGMTTDEKETDLKGLNWQIR
jgi:hypothetical protein